MKAKDDINEIIAYYSEGHSMNETAKKFGCSKSTVSRWVNIFGKSRHLMKQSTIDELSDQEFQDIASRSSSYKDFAILCGLSHCTTANRTKIKARCTKLGFYPSWTMKTMFLTLDRTKGEIMSHYSNRWSPAIRIRKLARETYKHSGRPLECAQCRYNRTIEVAHIKAVSEFDDSATLREINHIDNLIALCPNHHWEFDHGYLNIKDIHSPI